MDGWHFTPFSPLAIQGRLHGHGGQFWICKKWWLITWLVFTSYPNNLLRLSLISWNSSTISNLLHEYSITPLFTIHRCTFSFFFYMIHLLLKLYPQLIEWYDSLHDLLLFIKEEIFPPMSWNFHNQKIICPVSYFFFLPTKTNVSHRR